MLSLLYFQDRAKSYARKENFIAAAGGHFMRRVRGALRCGASRRTFIPFPPLCGGKG